MLLSELLADYINGHEYGVTAGHAEQLRYSVSNWEKHLGRPLSVADLNDSAFNEYMDWYRARRKPDSVRTRRGNILILWHHAFNRGFTETAPRRIRKLRPIYRAPEAWTVAEVKQLIATAEGLPGCFWRTKLTRAAWWSSLFRAAYDSGLRLGDLLSVHRNHVAGLMIVVQHKTGRHVAFRLRPATLAAIDQTLADEPRDLVWPLWCGRQTFYEHVNKLVELAGVRRGTFRWLRKSAATQVESIAPGRGTELLGHASRATTEAWYIDRSQLTEPPLPPL